MTKTKAQTDAQKNLAMVVKAVGATPVPGCNNTFILTKGRSHLMVRYGSATKIRNPRNPFGSIISDTCCKLMGPYIPIEENIATLLLVLNHNPRLYNRCLRREGWFC